MLYTCVYGYTNYFSQEAQDEHVKKVFNDLTVQTGQSEDTPKFRIVESDTINAYTNGKDVVIFRGMLNFVKNDDELAMVLSHELAHVMLRHTSFSEFQITSLETSQAEANADKLGAIYMIKSGYDVCKARDLWMRMLKTKGNYQGNDHPTYSYRFDELNINCE